MPGKKKQSNEQEGDVYVWSGGLYYAKPVVNSDTLLDAIGNKYVADSLNKLRSMIFVDKYEIEVLDPEREPDKELQTRLMSMAESIRLWPKMQMAWVDEFGWGVSPWNPVWEWVDGEYVLTDLRRLPPESFASQAPGASLYCDEILKGICLGKSGEVEYWQTSNMIGSAPKPIKNIYPVKDPTSPGMAGRSKIIPLLPIISMLNYTWRAQMQKVNRIGAPNIFIKVTNPIGLPSDTNSDVSYAQKILNNWGKDSAYQLRENMTVENVNPQDNQSALQTIQQLERSIKDYFSPSSLFKKEGDTLGGNAGAEKDLTDLYISGQHTWIEDAFEPLFDTYFEANGYEGYELQIHIGKTAPSLSYVEEVQAKLGFETRTMSPNEIRAKLGMIPLSPEEMEETAAAWQVMNVPTGGTEGSSPVTFKDLEHQPGKAEKEAIRKIKKAQDEAVEEIVRRLE
jgi:hypothetical protein